MDFNNKKVMHIDTSMRFNQKGSTGIAFKIIETNEHAGIILDRNLKRKLKKMISSPKDYPKLYAIYIYYLIKDSLDKFDCLIICNDEKYSKVKKWLDIFFCKNKRYLEKEITSISKLRKITGNSKLRSYADNIANIYRKKGVRAITRRQKGIKLNIIKVNYEMIYSKWIIK